YCFRGVSNGAYGNVASEHRLPESCTRFSIEGPKSPAHVSMENQCSGCCQHRTVSGARPTSKRRISTVERLIFRLRVRRRRCRIKPPEQLSGSRVVRGDIAILPIAGARSSRDHLALHDDGSRRSEEHTSELQSRGQ